MRFTHEKSRIQVFRQKLGHGWIQMLEILIWPTEFLGTEQNACLLFLEFVHNYVQRRCKQNVIAVGEEHNFLCVISVWLQCGAEQIDFVATAVAVHLAAKPFLVQAQRGHLQYTRNLVILSENPTLMQFNAANLRQHCSNWPIVCIVDSLPFRRMQQ